MKTLNLVQGSQEWISTRARYKTASEASMMMGSHPNVKRNELLHMKATGTEQEFSDYVKNNIIDNGHIVEAEARPIAEAIINDELFPVTGVNGDYLASFDGLTMMEDIGWECKSWNEEKAEKVMDGDIPEGDKWQVVQQLMISGAEKILYMVTDGTRERTVYVWVYPDRNDFEQLIAGWKQFQKDLEVYEPQEIKQAPTAEVIRDLPSVTVQVKGELTLSNLDDVTPMFDKFIDNAVVTFETDQDFADAEAQSKVARSTAKACKQTARSVVDQMLSVSEAVKTLEEYAAKFDKLGLQQEKAVKAEKENIKLKLANAASGAYIDHIAALEAEIAPIRLGMQLQNNHFMLQMKNKRTIASLKDAVDTALAKAKIEADTVAAKFRKNLAFIREEASEYKFLFNDLQLIIDNEYDAFAAIVKSRITEHKEAEEKRLEAERERIAAEEKEKAEQEANARIEAEKKRDADEAEEERAKTEKQEIVKSVEAEIAAEEKQAHTHPETKKQDTTKTQDGDSSSKINKAAINAIMSECGLLEETAKEVVTAIAKGLIPAVKINY